MFVGMQLAVCHDNGFQWEYDPENNSVKVISYSLCSFNWDAYLLKGSRHEVSAVFLNKFLILWHFNLEAQPIYYI